MNQLLIQGVDGNVKADFKAACAKRKTTMKKVLTSFMEKYSKPDKRRR
jgi:hypothetical protein